MGTSISNNREYIRSVMKEVSEIAYEQDGVAYSLETVVAEKFQTMIVRAFSNSRMKDFYDLYTILNNRQFNAGILQEAIQNTFANRKTEYDPDNIVFTDAFRTDKDLSVRWTAFMKKLKADTPPTFIEVTDYIQKQLKPYWEELGRKIE